MYKRIYALLLIFILAVSLVGCGKKAVTETLDSPLTLEWKDGVIYYDGQPTDIIEHAGYYAKVTNPGNGATYTIAKDNATDPSQLLINTEGVLEENMNKYKETLWWTLYLQSIFVQIKDYGNDNWKTAECATEGRPAESLTIAGLEYMDNIPLTDKYVVCDFGEFTASSEWDEAFVKESGYVIKNVIKVTSIDKMNLPVECNESYMLYSGSGAYEWKVGHTQKFDYYTYGNYAIQIAAGVSIDAYITFK